MEPDAPGVVVSTRDGEIRGVVVLEDPPRGRRAPRRSRPRGPPADLGRRRRLIFVRAHTKQVAQGHARPAYPPPLACAPPSSPSSCSSSPPAPPGPTTRTPSCPATTRTRRSPGRRGLLRLGHQRPLGARPAGPPLHGSRHLGAGRLRLRDAADVGERQALLGARPELPRRHLHDALLGPQEAAREVLHRRRDGDRPARAVDRPGPDLLPARRHDRPGARRARGRHELAALQGAGPLRRSLRAADRPADLRAPRRADVAHRARPALRGRGHRGADRLRGERHLVPHVRGRELLPAAVLLRRGGRARRRPARPLREAAGADPHRGRAVELPRPRGPHPARRRQPPPAPPRLPRPRPDEPAA